MLIDSRRTKKMVLIFDVPSQCWTFIWNVILMYRSSGTSKGGSLRMCNSTGVDLERKHLQ
jgi:hypothetical protein